MRARMGAKSSAARGRFMVFRPRYRADLLPADGTIATVRIGWGIGWTMAGISRRHDCCRHGQVDKDSYQPVAPVAADGPERSWWPPTAGMSKCRAQMGPAWIAYWEVRSL